MNKPKQFLPLSIEVQSHLQHLTQESSQTTYMPWFKIFADKFFLLSCFVLFFILLSALAGPFFSGHLYDETLLLNKNLSPNWHYWFGTDELGRDLFTRCCWGARISFTVGFVASFIDLIIGVSYGFFAGYFNQRVSKWMMSFMDILQSIPYLLIVILLIVINGPGLLTIIFALVITGWINMARTLRIQIYQLKKNEFILAAQLYGASTFRIFTRHILPHVMPTILVIVITNVSLALFTEAFLSFLGLGVQAPVASWGTLANDGLTALRYYPWRLFFPAFLIFITIFCLNLMGERLRIFFNVRPE